jgi:hypothetical protein
LIVQARRTIVRCSYGGRGDGVDWVGGNSLVLPGDVAEMVVAGPVIRWSDQ